MNRLRGHRPQRFVKAIERWSSADFLGLRVQFGALAALSLA